MIVLAFDIAGRTGWCCGATGLNAHPPGPDFGHFGVGLEGAESLGRCLYDFQRNVDELLMSHPGVTCLAWEKPIQASKHAAVYDEFVKGAIGILRVQAFIGELEALPCDMKAVRRHFIGQGTGDAKQQVWQRCKVLGYPCKNDDESDAIATWDYACAIMKARHYAETSRGFGGSGGRAVAAPGRARGHGRSFRQRG